MERSRIEQREKLGYSSGLTKASADIISGSEPKSCLQLEQEVWVSPPHLHHPIIGDGLPLSHGMFLK